jgi:hypothetical protein
MKKISTIKILLTLLVLTISKISFSQCNAGTDMYLINDSTLRFYARFENNGCINNQSYPIIAVNNDYGPSCWCTWGPNCGSGLQNFTRNISILPNTSDTLDGFFELGVGCQDLFHCVLNIDSNKNIHFGNILDTNFTYVETTRSLVTNNLGGILSGGSVYYVDALEIFNEQEVQNPVMNSGVYSGTITNISDVSDTLQMLMNNNGNVKIQCTDGTMITANTSGYNNALNTINFSANIPNGKTVTRVLASHAWIKVPEFLSGAFCPIPSVSQIPTSICSNSGAQICKLNNPYGTITITLDNNPVIYNSIDSTFSINLGTVGSHNIHVHYYYMGASSNLDTSFTTLALPVINNVNTSSGYQVCNGVPVTLNATGGAASYMWTFTGATGGNNFTGSVINNIPFSITNTFNTYSYYYYYFKVVATGLNGCMDSITQVPVIVSSTSSIYIASTPSNATVCPGQNITLNATGTTGYNPVFNWSGGITNNVSFTPLATTIYTVTCTSFNGCTSTATKLVTVSTNSMNITSTPTNSTVCAGQSVILNATGANSYNWSGGISNNVSFVPTATTTYTVTGTTANGCNVSATKLVTVNASPTINITSTPTNAIVCAGNSATLNATGASTYSWSGGINNNISFIPTATTTYTVTATGANTCTKTATKTVTVSPITTLNLTASICQGQNYLGYTTNGLHIDTFINSNGCDSIRTINLTVNALPTINITSTPTNSTVCAGQSVILNATGANSYSWSGGITNNVSFLPTATTIYTVTATSSNGCSKTSTKSVIVNYTTSSALNATICQGQNYLGYTTAGVHIDTFINSNGCDSIRTINLTVNVLPTINITSTPTNATVCAGQSVTLNATGGTSPIWSGGISNNVSFTPTASTTYTVTATGTNGCTNTNTKTVTVNNLPTISITATPTNATVCAGQNLILNTTGASTYVYSPTCTNNIAFVPTASATYTVIATDVNGCTKTATKAVVVNTLPTINITSTPTNATVCAGQSVTLNATGGTSPIWSGGISNNVAFTPSATTTYTVTATGTIGCTNTNTKTVTVNALPSINITATPSNAIVCNGQNAILNATGASAYSWSGGISNNVSFIPTATTTYTVTATGSNSCTNTSTKTIVVGNSSSSSFSASICQGQNYLGYTTAGVHLDTFVNANGCDSIRAINLTVNNLPTVTINATPTNTNICAGQSITLNGNGANAYSWSGGINNAVNFIPTATNTYTITGTDINNCSNTASVTVTVTPLPTINIGVSPNDTICAGDNVLLNATSTGATLTWNGGITNNSTFAPVATSNYIVTATSSANNLCSSTATQHIEVVPNINPTLSVSSSISQGVTGASVTYTATTNVPLPYSINWYLNNIFQTTTTSNNWNTTLVAGTNNVYATIKSITNCLQPDSATSNIAKVNNITSINDIEIDGLKVYPNPFTDFISIEGLQPKDKIVLYNMGLDKSGAYIF